MSSLRSGPIRVRSIRHPISGRENPRGGTTKAALVILGATGGIGRGVVRAALDRGHRVLPVARQADALDALRLEHRGAGLTTVPGQPDASGHPFGPDSRSPADSCPSLVAVRALPGRFSPTGYNKDLPS